jgi:nucleoside-triphosphatase THEP1
VLLILTGDIQIGKTRWLQRSIERLGQAGVVCEGVGAPGVWREHAGERGAVSYEKEGIDNVLLPEGERVPFARREDLARAEGTYRPQNQAAQVGMTWHIDDAAVARVNAHFDALDARPAQGGPRLLVVDELGRLELLHDGGLTSAVRMLAAGPRGRYAHALVVARSLFGLADLVEERFAGAWGGAARLAPTEQSWSRWLEPLT